MRPTKEHPIEANVLVDMYKTEFVISFILTQKELLTNVSFCIIMMQ